MNRNISTLIFAIFILVNGCATSRTIQPEPKTVATPIQTQMPICKTPEPEPKIVRFEYEVSVHFASIISQLLAQADSGMEETKLLEKLMETSEFSVEIKGPHPYYDKKVVFRNSELECKISMPCKLDIRLGKLDFSLVVIINIEKPAEMLVKNFIALLLKDTFPTNALFELKSIKLTQANGAEEIRWQEEKETSINGAMVVQLAEAE